MYFFTCKLFTTSMNIYNSTRMNKVENKQQKIAVKYTPLQEVFKKRDNLFIKYNFPWVVWNVPSYFLHL